MKIYPDSSETKVIFLSQGEKMIYDKLKEKLSNGWHVFYSVQLSDIQQRVGLADNEIDFIMYHKSYGLALVEVKGGRIRYSEEKHQFFSIDRNNRQHRIKNPFRQILVSKNRMISSLSKQNIRVPITHIVCLPNTKTETLPNCSEIAREVIIGLSEIDTFENRLKSIIKNVQPEKYLNFPDQIDQIKKYLLPSSFVEVLHLKDYIDDHERKISDNDHIHATLVEPIAASVQLGVEGEAGTGKSMLAALVAQKFESQGKSVLILSSGILVSEKMNAVRSDKIKIQSYIGLAKEFGINLLIKPKDLDMKSDEWVQIEAPSRLMEEIDKRGQKYDVVICDEAQDVQPFWWDAFTALKKSDDTKSEPSHFYVFFDRSQGVFGSGGKDQEFKPDEVLPVAGPYFPLLHNYRTTKEIAEISKEFRNKNASFPSHSSREGYLPTVIKYKDQADAQKKLEQLCRYLIKDEMLLPSQLALLSARKFEAKESIMHDQKKIGDVELDFLSKGVRTKTDSKIMASTVQTFKGCETDVAIVINFDEYKMPLDNPIMSSLLYVACTRAKHKLYILMKEGSEKCRAVVQAIKSIDYSGSLVVQKQDQTEFVAGKISSLSPGRIGWIDSKDADESIRKYPFLFVDVEAGLRNKLKVGSKVEFCPVEEGDLTFAVHLKVS